MEGVPAVQIAKTFHRLTPGKKQASPRRVNT
jgi:hypothetical protein